MLGLMLQMRGEWQELPSGTHGSYQFHTARSIFKLNVQGNMFSLRAHSPSSVPYTRINVERGQRLSL